MSLIGRYYCKEINSTLVITEASNNNGRGKGFFELEGITIPVQIHYHFKDNVGPVTNLWFAGNVDDPNEYVGGAGRTVRPRFESIEIAGGYPTEKSVKTFEGTYERIYYGEAPK